MVPGGDPPGTMLSSTGTVLTYTEAKHRHRFFVMANRPGHADTPGSVTDKGMRDVAAGPN